MTCGKMWLKFCVIGFFSVEIVFKLSALDFKGIETLFMLGPGTVSWENYEVASMQVKLPVTA